MTPWGRIGGSQENVSDLGPLADMIKFAGGLPGATGGPIQILNMGISILHVHYAVMIKTYILKTAVNTNSRASSVVTALLAGGPSPALLLGNTLQV